MEYNEFIAEIERPYQCLMSKLNGKDFRDICNIEIDGHLAITVNHHCTYVSSNQACKFCGISNWRDANDRSRRNLIEAVKLAMDMGEVKHISITTGTMPTPDRGIKGILNLLHTLHNEVNLRKLPIFAEFEPPQDIKILDELKNAGVRTVACNLEFLDDNVRKKLMPGKGSIPYEIYAKTWDACSRLFGKSQVFSNIMMLDSDKSSTVQRISNMISQGCIPSLGIMYMDPHSSLKNSLLISYEKALSTLQTTVMMLKENGKSDPRKALAGCHRNGAYSTINEFYAATE